MWAMSDAAVAVQAQSHRAVFRLHVLHGRMVVAELSGVVLSGQVTADPERSIMRNLALSIVDVDGTLSNTDLGGLLSPYEAEVRPWRGVVLPSGDREWVPLGTFRLTNSDITDGDSGMSVNLTGHDRALIYQTPLPGPVTISAGTPVETAIGTLLSRVYAGFSWDPWRTGVTLGPLLYDSSDQAWDAALTLAESVGGWLFHDRMGEPVFAPFGNNPSTASQRFAETLLSVTKGEDSDEIHNSVVMQSTDSGVGRIVAVAEDLDIASPTYVNGRHGRRQITITNPHIGGPVQAKQAAVAQLTRELGRSETITWECVPDLRTDPEDLVKVHRPRAGVVDRQVSVASLSMPLDVTGSMQVTGRRTIIGQDGGPV